MSIDLRANELAVRDWCGALERGDLSAMKAASLSLPFGGGASSSPSWWGDGKSLGFGGASLPGARADYASRAGALHKNATVAACLGWIVDNFGQAVLHVTSDAKLGEDDEPEAIPDHPLVAMLKRPNEYYSTRILWASTVMAWKLEGNAYWLKLRGAGGRGAVVGVRFIPSGMVRPKVAAGPSDTYIDGYQYRTGSRWDDIPGGKDAVVHFRDALSPDDERMGWRRIESVLRQISATNEGATYTASVLENMGVSPYLFTGTEGNPLDESVGKRLLQAFHGMTGGANRGMAFAAETPLEAHDLGKSPQDMALDTMLDRPVAEICALMGLSPMVLGLPDASRTYDNYATAIRAAFTNCVIPLQDSIADDLQHQLLPDFAADANRETVGWDRKRIRALQEDETEVANCRAVATSTAVAGFQGGLYPLATAQKVAGVEITEGAEELWYAPGGPPEALPGEYAGDPPPADPGVNDAAAIGEAKAWLRDEMDAIEAEGVAAEPISAKSLGLSDVDFAMLRPTDLADLGDEAMKASVAARRAKTKRRAEKRHASGGGKPGGKFEETKHPRDHGRFAHSSGLGGSKAPSSHIRLERRAAVAQKFHERLKANGVAGKEYDHALGRAVRLKQEAHAARQVRARKLVERRKSIAAKQRAAAAPAPEAARKAGFIGEVPTSSVYFDPTRFQYKMAVTDSHTGSVGSLAGVKKWDHELAGVVSVWKDPANGKTFVVNGHNRLDLAKQLGVDKVAVRYLDAPDAIHARAKGALANIAEGRGTSMDAAKFFRDSGITHRSELQARGIPLTEAKTGEGLALAGLSNPLFRRAIDGTLPTRHAAIIGGGGLHHEQQGQLAKLYDKQKGNVTESHLREWVDEAKAAGHRTKDSGPSMFGDSGPSDESLFLHRTALNAHVKERLGREKKLFGTVSRRNSADQLSQAGNVIDAAASGKVSRDAGEALHVFDTLKRTSVFSGATNAHSERMATAKNEGERKKIRDEYYAEVKRRVRDAYTLGN